MAYNPYNDILEIYRAGNDWQNEQDENKRKTIQQNAQTYYNKLRDNGYGSVADELQVSDSIKRKQILDRYSAPVTPQETINASQTIPNPGSAGTTNTDNSAKTLINNGNNSIFEKYEREYTDLKDTNPFETEVGKSILAKYDLAGLQARDNEVASEAGSNDGNIDSFAAANALRQQTALVTKGQEVVLDAHQQKLNHARALLSDMGVHIDRVFTQDETSKNNDVARKSEIASVTGYVPDEWVVSNNPYMNEDGTIKDEYKDVDFAAVMANAKAAGNTDAYNAAAQARYYKIMGNYGVYGKWDNGDYIVPGQQKTEIARQFDKQIDSAERIAKGENDTNLALADKQIAANVAPENNEYVNVVYIEPLDESKYPDGLDDHGIKALKGLIDLANTKGGVLEEDEVIDYLVKNSATNQTNKNQLGFVLQYLGLGSNLLNNVENVNKDQGNGGWKDGVKFSASR